MRTDDLLIDLVCNRFGWGVDINYLRETVEITIPGQRRRERFTSIEGALAWAKKKEQILNEMAA